VGDSAAYDVPEGHPPRTKVKLDRVCVCLSVCLCVCCVCMFMILLRMMFLRGRCRAQR
jgi:hypothetical protein